MQPAAETAQPDAAPYLRGLDGIIGQDAVVSVLRSAISAGRPHHARICSTDQKALARPQPPEHLMAALNCQHRLASERPVEAASRAARLRVGSHPDFVIATMELAGLADEVERLIRRLAYRPVEGRAQVVLIDPPIYGGTDGMVAANRLLKTLEEPRPDTHFVLISTSANGLLQTIRSRCQRLRFVPPDELIAQTLQNQAWARRRQCEIGDGTVAKAASVNGALCARSRFAQKASDGSRRTGCRSRGDAPSKSVDETSKSGPIETKPSRCWSLWLKLHAELRQHGQKPDSFAVTATCAGATRVVRETQTAIRRYTSAPLSLRAAGTTRDAATSAASASPAGEDTRDE